MTMLSFSRSQPALEQAKRLQAAYDVFNIVLFAEQLPPTMLRIERLKNSRGYFSPNKFTDLDNNAIDCITLNSTDVIERPLIELLSTLVHEQCHQFVYRVLNGSKATGGHGTAWREQMERVGLPPIKIGATWRMATHSINPSGLYAGTFEECRGRLQALPWAELANDATTGRAPSLDKVKHECPSCGSKAWARGAAELLCGTCTTANPLHLVAMLPEFRSTTTGTSSRTDYPEPSLSPALPVWTTELGRVIRLHCGIDHPPTNVIEALVVMIFGVYAREPELMAELEASLDDLKDDQERWGAALKAIYRHRAAILHPDAGGHEEAFKVLQVARQMLGAKVRDADVRAATAKEKAR